MTETPNTPIQSDGEQAMQFRDPFGVSDDPIMSMIDNHEAAHSEDNPVIQLPPFEPFPLKFFDEPELDEWGDPITDDDTTSSSGINLALMMIPDDSSLATASYAERMAAMEPIDTGVMTIEALEAAALAETDCVLVGVEAEEIPCETCGKLFWSLDVDHAECRTCDELAGLKTQVATLETTVADLLKFLNQMERRIARESDFSDFQSSRPKGDFS